MKYFFVILSSFLIFKTVTAQIYERNKGESREAFVKRIFPPDASIQFKTLENKLNSPGKRIIFFSKKPESDTSINKNEKINCLFANILVPENETSNKYSLQTLLIDCNRDYNVQIENATVEKDSQNNPFINILFCQLNRASTRLLIKTYKTFHLKQTSGSNFSIEEVKE